MRNLDCVTFALAVLEIANVIFLLLTFSHDNLLLLEFSE